MKSADSSYWWTFFLRGCITIIFGFISFFWIPLLELGLIVSFFGAFILLQGTLATIAYLMIEKTKQSLPVLLEGILGISIGAFLLQVTRFPEASFLVSFVAWGIGTGICKVVRSSFLYRNHTFYFLLGINGLISVLFNVFLFYQAKATVIPLAGILSIYFIVYGTLLLIFGIRLKPPVNGRQHPRGRR